MFNEKSGIKSDNGFSRPENWEVFRIQQQKNKKLIWREIWRGKIWV